MGICLCLQYPTSVLCAMRRTWEEMVLEPRAGWYWKESVCLPIMWLLYSPFHAHFLIIRTTVLEWVIICSANLQSLTWNKWTLRTRLRCMGISHSNWWRSLLNSRTINVPTCSFSWSPPHGQKLGVLRMYFGTRTCYIDYGVDNLIHWFFIIMIKTIIYVQSSLLAASRQSVTLLHSLVQILLSSCIWSSSESVWRYWR